MLRRCRSITSLVALALLVTATTAVVTASSTDKAAAVCTGAGQPLTIGRYDLNGTLVAAEGAPYPGSTCNNDSGYSGLVLDPVTDGSCAYAYYLEPLVYYANQGTSCTTGTWVSYGYTDLYGTNSVFVSTRPSYLVDDWKISSGY